MNTISGFRDMAELELSRLNLTQEPADLYAPISYVLNIGGKRIRPALCLAGCHFFSGDANLAMQAALGLEVFHNFTLLHDDIMDNAPIRRGNPTVHEKWGVNGAILSGDAMMIKASQLMLQVPHHCLKEVQEVFLQTALEVCEGQQYDMDFELRNTVTVDQYLEMIRLKTAVLVGGSLKIGALIGGASSSDANLIYDFGVNVGLAFQLQDDFLDVYGDEELFGKAIGGDIVANKKTFLLISCLESAAGDDLANLEQWIKASAFNRDEKVEAVRKLYDKLNIPALSRKKMDQLVDKALHALDATSMAPHFKEELKQFALKLMNRLN